MVLCNKLKGTTINMELDWQCVHITGCALQTVLLSFYLIKMELNHCATCGINAKDLKLNVH